MTTGSAATAPFTSPDDDAWDGLLSFIEDLPAERDRLTRPVVYHLFGKLSAFPTYVISDEDLLEYSDPRDVGEVFAADYTAQDDRLVAFLQQVSVRTRIYTGPERFVEELHGRWQKRKAFMRDRDRAQ